MYIIYKTTNNVNGKFYVGVHKTNNLNDNYLGSGIAIKAAIKIHGRKNFSREILYVFKTSKEAYDKEREIVDQHFLSRDDVYNLTEGGIPSIDSLNDNRIYEKTRHTQANRIWINDTISNSLHLKELPIPDGWIKGKIQRKPIMTAEQLHIKGLKISISNKGRVSPMKGKTLTDEDKKNKSIAALNKTKKTCEHCGKQLDAGNYSLWHGFNCKFKIS